MLVDQDAVPELDAAVAQKAKIRRYADRDDHQVAGKDITGAGRHRPYAAVALERGGSVVHAQFDSSLRAETAEEGGQFRSGKLWEQEIAFLDQHDMNAHAAERCGGLDTEVAAAEDNDALGVLGGPPQRLGIRQSVQAMNAGKHGARDGRANWFRPSSDQQLVEMDIPGQTRAHQPLRRIDADDSNAKHYVDRLLLVVSFAMD